MKVVIIGVGDVGSHIAQWLSEEGANVTVIDRSIERIQAIEDKVDAATMVGNATHSSVLRAAGVKSADLVIGVTGIDAVNLVVCSLAKELGAAATIARVDDPEFYQSGSRIEVGIMGVDAIVCASRLVSAEIIRMVLESEYENVYSFTGYSCAVGLFKIPDGSHLVDKNVDSIGLPAAANLAGVIRNRILRGLDSIQTVQPDDELVITGSPDCLLESMQTLNRERLSRKAIIVGGGDVGSQVAGALLPYEKQVEIVEVDRSRCEHLSRTYTDASVLHADGTDIGILKELGINASDYVVAVSGTDEINLMVSLIAKDLGAGISLTRINRPGYRTVYVHLGITATASPHTIMSRFVDDHLVRECIARIEKTELSHCFVELKIPEFPRDRHPKLGDIDLPSLSIILGHVRNYRNLEISRSHLIKPGDSIIVAVQQSAVKEIERKLKKSLA